MSSYTDLLLQLSDVQDALVSGKNVYGFTAPVMKSSLRHHRSRVVYVGERGIHSKWHESEGLVTRVTNPGG